MDSPCVLTVFGGVALLHVCPRSQTSCSPSLPVCPQVFQHFSLPQNIPFLLKTNNFFSLMLDLENMPSGYEKLSLEVQQ